ncbi:MAG TPA: SDR family NAD(P)-dependent oxidoreductase, partial [Solimonas sp.]|nr:SDR family NAD(P)-dependent oxidoreductase [Solimonas sp.]
MYRTVLEQTVMIRRPLADCFRYLADFSTCEQWDPGVHSARKETPGPVRVGSRFALQLSTPAGRRPMHYEMLALDPGHELRLLGEGEGLLARDHLRFEALDEGSTRLRYRAELEFTGLGQIAGRVAEPWLQRLGRAAVSGLRQALEPEPPPPTAEATQPGWEGLLMLPTAWRFTERGYRSMPHRAHTRWLDGRTVVLTGPTGGIGLAAACELARLGARLVLVGRGTARMEQAAEKILDFAGSDPGIRLVEADLSSAAEVRHATDAILDLEPRIDVLINNAGALSADLHRTAEGHERTLAVNLLAPYRLTLGLLPALERSGGRVINVSSGGQYLQKLDPERLLASPSPHDGMRAYAEAKRALVTLTRSWAQSHPRVAFHAMHPGWAATPGVARSLPRFDRTLRPLLRDARMGADTVVWLATADPAWLGSGGFWFDRRPQPLDVLPATRVDARDSQQ